MASSDRQFQPLGNVATPASWTLPGSLEIIPKSVFASFDGTNASGDFLPTLQIVSDSGKLISEVPVGSTVTAGDTADVTWAPFLRSAPATAAAGLQGQWNYVSSRALNPHGGGSMTLNDSTVSEIGWSRHGDNGTYGPLDEETIPAGTGVRITAAVGGFGGPVAMITFHIKVIWPSFAGRRYVEVAPDNGDPAYALPFRLEGSSSPQDDTQVLTGTFTEQTGTLTGLVVNLFQASGGPVTLTDTTWGQFFAVGPVP